MTDEARERRTKTAGLLAFAARREHFGPKRTTGARALRGVEANGLCALRDLRVREKGVSQQFLTGECDFPPPRYQAPAW